MIGIYCIENIINGKKYIGLSQNIELRWQRHRSELKRNKHKNKHLQAAYNLYGVENFKYTILEECESDSLNEREQYWIAYYDTLNQGYNQNIGGGSCCGYKHSEEEIQKMQQVQHPKAVLQIDNAKNIVAEYPSASTAAKKNGTTARYIKAVCERKPHQKSLLGFIWVYKEEYDNNLVDWDFYLNNNREIPHSILEFDVYMNFIQEWGSIYQASKHYHMVPGVIAACISGEHRVGRNRIWRNKDTYSYEKYEQDKIFYSNYSSPTAPKSIEQYSSEGVYIASYNSITQVERQMKKRGLYAAMKRGDGYWNGYLWRFCRVDLTLLNK